MIGRVDGEEEDWESFRGRLDGEDECQEYGDGP